MGFTHHLHSESLLASRAGLTLGFCLVRSIVKGCVASIGRAAGMDCCEGAGAGAGRIKPGLKDVAAWGERLLQQPKGDSYLSKAALASACSGAASLNAVTSISASPKIH